MKVTLDSTVLSGKILKPLSRVVDDCVLTISDSKLESVASMESGAIIMYVSYDVETDIEEEVKLNIQDISKLNSTLLGINGASIDMTIEPNRIKYESDEYKFLFHLTDDGVITVPKLKKEKLKNIEVSTSMDLDVKKFHDILKSCSHNNNENTKLYFYTKSADDATGLYCDITDKRTMNSNSITIKLSDTYEGDDVTREMICDVEHLRKISINRDSNIKLSFNSKIGFIIFDLVDDIGKVRYIIPELSN